MTLESVLKIIGWIFVLVPTVAFLTISFTMIKGAANDDATVKALVLLAVTTFFMGTILLLALYFTNIVIT